MKEKALDDIFDEVSRLIILSGLLPIRRSCDKGKKFGNIISEFQKENNTYGEVFSSITLLFKNKMSSLFFCTVRCTLIFC